MDGWAAHLNVKRFKGLELPTSGVHDRGHNVVNDSRVPQHHPWDVCLCVCVSVCVCVCVCVPLTHSLTHSLTHTHTHSLSHSHSVPHTQRHDADDEQRERHVVRVGGEAEGQVERRNLPQNRKNNTVSDRLSQTDCLRLPLSVLSFGLLLPPILSLGRSRACHSPPRTQGGTREHR